MPTDADIPTDGFRHDLGLARFNFRDTAITCSRRYPAMLRSRGSDVWYFPFARIMNPQQPDSPDDLWEPGFARTVRFQFSLSDASPAVARYIVPAWWYTQCGEPWPFGYLPVEGRFSPFAAGTAAHVRALMRRGGFDGGSADGGRPTAAEPSGNDGDTGIRLMTQAWLTGDLLLYQDTLPNSGMSGRPISKRGIPGCATRPRWPPMPIGPGSGPTGPGRPSDGTPSRLARGRCWPGLVPPAVPPSEFAPSTT